MTNVVQGPAGLFAKVYGLSGKMVFGHNCDPQKDPNGVSVRVDSVSEVDASGNPVGTGGKGTNKHQFTGLSATSFFTSKIYSTSVHTIPASAMNLTITFPVQRNDFTNSSIKLTLVVYIMTGSGIISLAPNTVYNESFQLTSGKVKFSVVVENWPFCNGATTSRLTNCKDSNGNAQVGQYLDVALVVGTKSPPTPKQGKKASANSPTNPFFDLANGYSLEMSRLVHVNNKQWVQMATGFPSLGATASKAITQNSNVFALRFPKFNGTVVYDPTISYSNATTLPPQSTTTKNSLNGNVHKKTGMFTLFYSVISAIFVTSLLQA